MEKKDLRIVYMGTPEFAVESLKRLVEGGYQVVGVITMPDKPMGRHGSVLQPSPVKQYAVSQGLKVLQPEKLKDENFLAELRDLKADLQIVVAFRMLPEVVWNMPRLGTFNLHASLLPQYRGAAPINWAVINGETETGITTFFLKHEIDTGEIIDQVRVPIADTDNVEIVYDKLMHLGGDLVVKTVDAILEGNVKTIPQEQLAAATELRPAPKIFKETCRIDWQAGVKKVYDFVRGLSPYPAYSTKESSTWRYPRRKSATSIRFLPASCKDSTLTNPSVEAIWKYVFLSVTMLPGFRLCATKTFSVSKIFNASGAASP